MFQIDAAERTRDLSKAALSMIAVLLVAVALGSGFVGLKLGVRYQLNAECCQIPLSRSLVVSAKEILGLATFYSDIGQDKWVSEAIFPDVKNGFLLDMGSETTPSFQIQKRSSKRLDWDLYRSVSQRNMQDRTCQQQKM